MHKYPVGVWESTQLDGSVVGIDLSEVPANESFADAPAGRPSKNAIALQVGVFRRLHTRVQCGEENYFEIGSSAFDPNPDNHQESYANGKLKVHYRDSRHRFEIQIALALDPVKNVWAGHFHRGTLDAQVTLIRVSRQPGETPEGCISWGSTTGRPDQAPGCIGAPRTQ